MFLRKIDNYLLDEHAVIGKGQFATVYKGWPQSDPSMHIAIKVIPTALIFTNQKTLAFTQREIAILKSLSNNHIVKLFDIYRTKNHLYICLEYCKDGDLETYLSKKGHVCSEEETFDFLKQFLEGQKILQENNIIHRDIKPSNILRHNGIFKIGDFGFARFVDDINRMQVMSMVGSPLQMAPEIISGKEYSALCDMWSLGVILFEMLYGTTPWKGESIEKLFDSIISDDLVIPEKPARSSEIVNLVKRMLQWNVKKRVGWKELFELMAEIENIGIDEEKKDDSAWSVRTSGKFVKQMKKNLLKEQGDCISSFYGKWIFQQMDWEDEKESKLDEKAEIKAIQYSNPIAAQFNKERNKAFFYRKTVKLLETVIEKKQIELEEDLFNRLFFCLMKLQYYKIYQILSMLQKPMQSGKGFTEEDWIQQKKLLSSKHKGDINDLLIETQTKLSTIFQTFLKEIMAIFKEISSKKEGIKSFFFILNDGKERNEEFEEEYEKSLKEFNEKVQLTKHCHDDVMNLAIQLNMCKNTTKLPSKILKQYSGGGAEILEKMNKHDEILTESAQFK